MTPIKPIDPYVIDGKPGCVSCGFSPVEAFVSRQTFPVGHHVDGDAIQVSAAVIIHRCPKCHYEWTDWHSELLRHYAAVEATASEATA